MSYPRADAVTTPLGPLAGYSVAGGRLLVPHRVISPVPAANTARGAKLTTGNRAIRRPSSLPRSVLPPLLSAASPSAARAELAVRFLPGCVSPFAVPRRQSCTACLLCLSVVNDWWRGGGSGGLFQGGAAAKF